MRKVIERKKNKLSSIMFLFFLSICFSQKKQECDSLLIKKNIVTDSILLKKFNFKDNHEIWSKKNDSIQLIYYRNVEKDSIYIRINNIERDISIELSRFIYLPQLIMSIPLKSFNSENNFTIKIFNENKMYDFNISLKDLENVQSIFFNQYTFETKDGICSYLDVKLLSYDYILYQKELRKKVKKMDLQQKNDNGNENKER